ncbi:DegT/DnrJ/EryC1/StrS family aminotransferase [Haladaptatus sp. DFWS20]|uniref:DegT/DnrJ/EryC1/StrS family aminotransferase n=1 Tax=Haladaptatus sp. DFWS20 TaxID=3403467 RepID=UPI003EB88017
MVELALHGGPAAAEGLSFPSWPQCTEQSKENILDALETEAWCRNYSDAEWVDTFEERFSDYQDAEYGIAVSNGTAAIEVALRMLDVHPGDEVIVPPYTFIATASAVTELGAVPIFADIDPDTYNLDADAVAEQVTENTVGVVGVHIAGYPMDFDELLPVVEEHDLFLVEDAAHAQGAEWRGERVGAIGDVGTFSFQASKALSGGEGGMVVTNDDVLAEQGRLVHNIGRMDGKVYRHYELASNMRLSEFQGALLCAQLDDLDDQLATRRRNDERLRAELADIDGISPKPQDDRITARGYCLYDLKYDPEAFDGLSRDDFLEALSAEGVPASKGYVMPMYKQPAFARNVVQARVPANASVPTYRNMFLPGVEEVTSTNISMSHQVLLAEEGGMEAIGHAIRKVAENVDILH